MALMDPPSLNSIKQVMVTARLFQATQRDLLDRQVQLEYLHRKSDDLHRCLPGLSPNQVNTSMDEICELVRTIEEQIAIAIRKGADEEADRSLGASTPSQPKDSTKEHDTISLSSAGAPSLALEVQVWISVL